MWLGVSHALLKTPKALFNPLAAARLHSRKTSRAQRWMGTKGPMRVSGSSLQDRLSGIGCQGCGAKSGKRL